MILGWHTGRAIAVVLAGSFLPAVTFDLSEAAQPSVDLGAAIAENVSMIERAEVVTPSEEPSLSTGDTGLAPAQSTLPNDAGWLETLNFYRTQSGLDPVIAVAEWTEGIRLHLIYLERTDSSLRTGIYANAHVENPASPWYTSEGALAGSTSNLIFGGASSDRGAINRWMIAPFHAIGIMRPGLTRSGFFRAANGSAGLDVIRGRVFTAPAVSPVLFPGDNSEVGLTRFDGELPDPREGCAPDWNQFRGLPIFALLPTSPHLEITATLTHPDGRTTQQGNQLCVVTGETFNSSDPVYGSTGKGILQGANAVLIIPRDPLTPGRYSVAVSQPGVSLLQWSFSVVAPPSQPQHISVLRAGSRLIVTWDRPESTGGSPITGYKVTNMSSATTVNVCDANPDSNFCIIDGVDVNRSASITVIAVNAVGDSIAGYVSYYPVSTPQWALAGGDTLMLQVADRGGVPRDAATVALNMTVVDSQAPGFATVYPCDQGLPVASNLNYGTGDTIPNLVLAKPDRDGRVCVYSYSTIHVLADVAGYFAAGSDFTPVPNPIRILDTRDGTGTSAAAQLAGGDTLMLQVADRGGVPRDAATVALNMTVVDSQAPGFATVYPCDQGLPVASNLNYGTGDTIPNLVLAKPDRDGRVCVYSYSTIHVLADVAGYFAAGSDFTPVPNPIRILDTRDGTGTSAAAQLAGGDTLMLQVADRGGVPRDAATVALNMTVVDSQAPGFATVYPCDQGLPVASNLNYGTGDTIPNLVLAKPDRDGRVCVYSYSTIHVLADVAGYFAAGSDFTPVPNPIRILDTRDGTGFLR